MATYNSDLMTNKVPFSGAYDGDEFQVTGNIVVKSGVKLGAADVLKFARFGKHVAIRKITLSVNGELDDGTVALDGTLGWLQALDSAGNALVHDDKTGTVYTSPASDPNGIVEAANTALEGLLQAQTSAVAIFAEDAAAGNAYAAAANDLATSGLEGPVDIGITITDAANGDAASDVTIRATFHCLQRNGAQGEWSGDLAEAYVNQYTNGVSALTS